LNDGVVAFEIESPDSVFIEATNWSWGDKGKFWTHAVRFDPNHPRLDAQVFIEELALDEWLNVISDGRISGQGRLFGRIPVTYQPDAERRLLFGRGFLYTQPEAGTLQMHNTEWVTNTLLADPQFTRDAAARQLRDRIIDSLKDFRYEQLAFEFIPRENDLQLKMVATGRGQGPGGVPLAPLTVNLNGYDQVLNNNVLPKLGSSQAITNALERFFGGDE
jgi:hypothetical protein